MAKRTLFPFTRHEPPAAYRCNGCDRWRYVSQEFVAAHCFTFDPGEPSSYPHACRSCLGGGVEIPEEAAEGPDGLPDRVPAPFTLCATCTGAGRRVCEQDRHCYADGGA